MPNPDLEHLRELFEAALDRPLSERAALLDERCAGEPELREQVEGLLAHEAESAGFLSGDAASLADGREPDSQRWVGRHVAGFQVRSLLARGGMGVVYEAEQDSPRRLVALKTLRQRYGSEDALRRFRMEVEVLGLLKHPGIAQIHGAGTIDDAGEQVPYIAMELVEGARTLPRFAVEQGLADARRLRLFQQACEAVEHGHRKGIVHRDLKPGNVLVDRSGAVKVIDFGLARVADPDALGVSLVETLQGGLLGTLEYMSPEHVSGAPLDVDVRSDVFSLGCILYELLTGRPPRDFAGLPIAASVQRLQTEDPEIPLNLPRELRWILIRALERSPDRRYVSAKALTEDIDRYLSHESVHAVQPTALYQLSKFSRRHRALLASLAAVIAALSIGIVQARREAHRAREAESVAVRESKVAWSVGSFLSDLFTSVNAYKQGPDARVIDIVHFAEGQLDNVREPDVHAILAAFVAEGLLNLSELDNAFEVFEPAWPYLRDELPREDPGRLHAGAVWVDLLEQRGEYQRSLEETQQLLGEAEQYLGPDHRDSYYLRQNLIVLLQRLGRYAEAEQVLSELLERLRPDPRRAAEVVNVLHRLGSIVAMQGRQREALAYFEEGAALADSNEQVSDMYATVIRMGMGSTYLAMGQLDRAQELTRRALREFDERGGSPSNVLAIRLNLAEILAKTHEAGGTISIEELQALVEETGELATELEAAPGRFHLSWLSIKSAHASIVGDHETSVEAARELVELSNAQYSDSNPYAVEAYACLARALEGLGEFDQVLAIYAEADDVVTRSSGAGSGDWRALTRQRARWLLRSGRPEAARELARELVGLTPEGAADFEQSAELLARIEGSEGDE